MNNRQLPDITDLDASQPMVEFYDEFSDIIQNTGRHNLMQSQSSKELVLQETKASQINSFRKVNHSVIKKIRLPYKYK
jgi:hypothetical protein